jgi:hypothetical protein
VTHPGDANAQVNKFNNRPPRLSAVSNPNLGLRVRSVSEVASPRDKKINSNALCSGLDSITSPEGGKLSDSRKRVDNSPQVSSSHPILSPHGDDGAQKYDNSNSNNRPMNSFLFGEDSSVDGNVNSTRKSSQLVENLNNGNDTPPIISEVPENKKTSNNTNSDAGNTSDNNSVQFSISPSPDGKVLRDSDKKKRSERRSSTTERKFTDKSTKSSAEKKDKPRRSSIASANLVKKLSSSDKDDPEPQDKTQSANLEKRRDRKSGASDLIATKKMSIEKEIDDLDGSKNAS